ncbi:MAG: DMT family transporter [Magnetococcales bacterium]|nr:DMT family transporter [Magnetococcales bacterium]
MPIGPAFLLLTLVWGSTPLAIQWSVDGTGYAFAVTARMAIGALGFLILLPWLQKRPAPLRDVAAVAVIAGVSMFTSMYCVYWGVRFLPSGWISVLFGLGPLFTGIIAALWLGEPFPAEKISGSLLGLGGLPLFFLPGEHGGESLSAGMTAILLAVLLYAAGNVAIKRHSRNVPPRWVAAGALWVAFPLFLAALLLSGDPWPTAITTRAGLAILYLGVVANLIGFLLFYHLLSRVSAANATLVTLSAPAVALWLGLALNREEPHAGVLAGTLLVLGGLALFQWGGGLSLFRGRK